MNVLKGLCLVVSFRDLASMHFVSRDQVEGQGCALVVGQNQRLMSGRHYLNMLVTRQSRKKNFKLYIIQGKCAYHDHNAGGSCACTFCTSFQRVSMPCALQGPSIPLAGPIPCTKSAPPPIPTVCVCNMPLIGIIFKVLFDCIPDFGCKGLSKCRQNLYMLRETQTLRLFASNCVSWLPRSNVNNTPCRQVFFFYLVETASSNNLLVQFIQVNLFASQHWFRKQRCAVIY